MNGLDITGSEIVVTDGTRTVFTTAGTPVNLLKTPIFDSTITVSFPDLTKGWFYRWEWESDYNGFATQYGWLSKGQSVLCARPQEWSAVTDLGDVPTGADIFVSRIKLSRTGSPSHTWNGKSIITRQPASAWLPFSGSCIVEALPNFARAFSIYIDGGKLKLHRQQTVGPAPGGLGTYGASTPTTTSDSDGGEVAAVSGGMGMPIWIQTSSPYFKSSTGTLSGTFPPATEVTKHKWNGSDPCSFSDPTNFASTYSVQVKGQYGRRS